MLDEAIEYLKQLQLQVQVSLFSLKQCCFEYYSQLEYKKQIQFGNESNIFFGTII